MNLTAVFTNKKQLSNNICILNMALFAGTTILTGTILASNTVSADDNTSVVDEINITVPVSCTISGTRMNTHNANINNGLYEENIGTTTLHAFCNDNEGLAIYAAGYTGNEVGGENSNKLVGTNASGNATIESGTATTAGNPDISNWAMKLAMTQDSGDTTGTNAFTIDSAPNVDLPSQAEQSATSVSFSQYHVVPNEYVKVAHKNSVTDMTDTTGGVKLTTTYAAYISKTQAADTYTGQVMYTLVHPASASAPLVCTPNGTTISTITCMQDITSTNKSTILASMTEGQQYTLVDNRDNKTYFVAKQADGNIWMTQNLDLCIGCDGVAPLTSENTDLNSYGTNSYNNGYSESNGVITWTPIASAITSNNPFSNGVISRPDYSDYVAYSAEGGDLYFYTSEDNNSDTVYESESECAAVHNDGTCPHYHIGNYYSRLAAIASNVADDYYTGWINLPASNSICPAGWRLPFGRRWNEETSTYVSSEYTTLLSEAGIYNDVVTPTSYAIDGFNKIRATPLFFTRADHIAWINNTAVRPDVGYYQTSSDGYFAILDYNAFIGRINDDGDSGFAMSVRCLVR